jgi:hypothetical protein
VRTATAHTLSDAIRVHPPPAGTLLDSLRFRHRLWSRINTLRRLRRGGRVGV